MNLEGNSSDRIFTIEIIGCTELNLKEPLNSVVVRVSIVHEDTGKLLRKKEEQTEDGPKETRFCFSPYEETEFIPPVATKAVTIEDIPNLRPKWQDSFLFNCLSDTILREPVIIFFEIIDMEIKKGRNSFFPVAWAFLRPKWTDGIENIDRTCKLQLHSYPKGFNTTIVNGKVPVATLLQKRKKIPSVLVIEIKNTNWVQPYDFTSRPTAYYQKEITQDDIQSLLEKHEEKPHVEIQERTIPKTVRPANKNCLVPRQLVAQIPVGQYGAYTMNFNNNGDLLVAAIRERASFALQFFSIQDFSKSFASIENAHKDVIYEIVFSPDDQLMMTASGDRDVKIWAGNGESQTPKYTLPHPCHVYSAKFHPNDQRLIATGGSDGIIRFWDGPTQKVLRECVGNEGTINSIVFSPDGNTLYAGDSAGIINVINTNISQNGIDDIVRKQVVREPELAKCGITHLSMERSNYLLLVQSKDSMLRVFETKVMVPSQRYTGIICTDTMLQSCFSPDCEYIASGSQDGTARCWTVRKAESIPTPEWSFKFDGPLTAVAWNRVENMIAFSSFASKMPIIVFQDPSPLQNESEDDEDANQY